MTDIAATAHGHAYEKELLERSSRFIDTGTDDGPRSTSPVSGELAPTVTSTMLVGSDCSSMKLVGLTTRFPEWSATKP